MLPTKQIETNSDGTQRITTFKYAHEVVDNSNGIDYSSMKQRNMLSQPYSITIADSSGKVLSKKWTLWKEFENQGEAFWRPESQWEWEEGNPNSPVFNN